MTCRAAVRSWPARSWLRPLGGRPPGQVAGCVAWRGGGPRLPRPFLAPPAAGRPAAPAVRPGHGLDGPEITSSWPVQPPVEDAESFAEFWAEDDDEAEYSGLFGDRDIAPEGARAAAKRRIGRRRG